MSAEMEQNMQAQREPVRISPLGWVLVVGWLSIPALQYLGAYIRTKIALDLARGARSNLDLQGMEQLALLDLTPWYVLLLVATLLFAYVQWRGSPRAGRTP